jgi:NADPH-dependent ferric siderophore reductase
MDRTTERGRHELRFRIAKVVRNERLTPRMARITLHDPDFVRFTSDAYDDHVKLFFARPGEALALPVAGPHGLDFPGGRPEGRDYTPRSFDTAKGEVVIDFVLHGDGPAASWAAAAKPGDTVGVGGPRASFVVRGAYDWYLLAGDETALPAIGRRIEELPAGASVLALIEIADAAERQIFHTAAHLELRWVFRSAGERLEDAVRQAALPPGTAYAFVAGESATTAAIRDHLVNMRGMDPGCIKAAGYWRSGEADFYDGHAH